MGESIRLMQASMYIMLQEQLQYESCMIWSWSKFIAYHIIVTAASSRRSMLQLCLPVLRHVIQQVATFHVDTVSAA